MPTAVEEASLDRPRLNVTILIVVRLVPTGSAQQHLELKMKIEQRSESSVLEVIGLIKGT